MSAMDDLEDICLWPDGTWCFVEDLPEFGFMSDDYRVIEFGCAEHDELTSAR
jgi:hypothetical protein